jgi:hypothetical protein
MENQGAIAHPRVEKLFGRGLNRIVWQLPVFCWLAGLAGIVLRGFLLHWMDPERPLPLASEEAVWNFLPLVVSSAVLWWGTWWLMGNVRKSVWLLLNAMVLNLVDDRLWTTLNALLQLGRGRGIGRVLEDAMEKRPSDLLSALLTALGWAVALVVVRKLRQDRLFLAPLVWLLALPASFLLVILQYGVALNRIYLLGQFPVALLIGLAAWAGLLLQRRRFASADPMPEPRINSGFFLFWPALGAVVGLDLIAVAVKARDETAVIAGVLAAAVLLSSFVMNLRFLYRVWASIRSPYTTSPGQAVGLLFIPLFNLYWIFQAFPGFAADYNSYADANQLDVPRLSRASMLVFVLGCLVGQIPLFSLFFTWLPPLTAAVMISRMGDAVNRLPEGAGTDSLLGLAETAPA